jgi:hypothetical protein
VTLLSAPSDHGVGACYFMTTEQRFLTQGQRKVDNRFS